jgi:hypothetical protein
MQVEGVTFDVHAALVRAVEIAVSASAIASRRPGRARIAHRLQRRPRESQQQNAVSPW